MNSWPHLRNDNSIYHFKIARPIWQPWKCRRRTNRLGGPGFCSLTVSMVTLSDPDSRLFYIGLSCRHHVEKTLVSSCPIPMLYDLVAALPWPIFWYHLNFPSARFLQIPLEDSSFQCWVFPPEIEGVSKPNTMTQNVSKILNNVP
jgi:hypothetical protein